MGDGSHHGHLRDSIFVTSVGCVGGSQICVTGDGPETLAVDSGGWGDVASILRVMVWGVRTEGGRLGSVLVPPDPAPSRIRNPETCSPSTPGPSRKITSEHRPDCGPLTGNIIWGSELQLE